MYPSQTLCRERQTNTFLKHVEGESIVYFIYYSFISLSISKPDWSQPVVVKFISYQKLSPVLRSFSTCPVQTLFKSYLSELLSMSVVSSFSTSVLNILLISFVAGAGDPSFSGAACNINCVICESFVSQFVKTFVVLS